MTAETWRAIPGYPDYDVSDQGRVISRKHGKLRMKALTSAGKSGHLNVKLSRDGIPKTKKVHQLVLLAFVGPRPPGLVTRHLNGCPSDNRLTNLAYGTHAENNRDLVDHGRHPCSVKTHCKHGHAFTEANTYITPLGKRQCRACVRRRARASWASR